MTNYSSGQRITVAGRTSLSPVWSATITEPETNRKIVWNHRDRYFEKIFSDNKYI